VPPFKYIVEKSTKKVNFFVVKLLTSTTNRTIIMP